jgi:hypothetical protein
MKFFDANGDFLNQYKGTFSEDRADGVIGIVEDNSSNLFQVETGVEEKGKGSGFIKNARLQNTCSI